MGNAAWRAHCSPSAVAARASRRGNSTTAVHRRVELSHAFDPGFVLAFEFVARHVEHDRHAGCRIGDVGGQLRGGGTTRGGVVLAPGWSAAALPRGRAASARETSIRRRGLNNESDRASSSTAASEVSSRSWRTNPALALFRDEHALYSARARDPADKARAEKSGRPDARRSPRRPAMNCSTVIAV